MEQVLDFATTRKMMRSGGELPAPADGSGSGHDTPLLFMKLTSPLKNLTSTSQLVMFQHYRCKEIAATLLLWPVEGKGIRPDSFAVSVAGGRSDLRFSKISGLNMLCMGERVHTTAFSLAHSTRLSHEAPTWRSVALRIRTFRQSQCDVGSEKI